MNAENALRMARGMTQSVTPLHFDCGLVCGGACCRAGDAGEGMLLFPGEEAYYSPMPEGFSILTREDGQKLLVCSGTCDRRTRPLACRVFPLLPFKEGSRAGVRMDARAWPVCPLMESGISGLRAQFTDAVKRAARLLLECPEHRAFLERLTDDIRRMRDF